MEKVQVLALAGSIGILLWVLELVRSGRLKENYSVLWISTSLVIIFFAVFRNFIDWLGGLAGIYYTPSAFFLLAFVFLVLITMQFSVVISRLTERNKVLAQELAVLKLVVEEIKAGQDNG